MTGGRWRDAAALSPALFTDHGSRFTPFMSHTIEAELAELRAHSLLRHLRAFDSPQQPAMATAGRPLVNFSSNDYLGLATEPALRRRPGGDQSNGAGACASVRTLTPHVRLEGGAVQRTEAALSFEQLAPRSDAQALCKGRRRHPTSAAASLTTARSRRRGPSASFRTITSANWRAICNGRANTTRSA